MGYITFTCSFVVHCILLSFFINTVSHPSIMALIYSYLESYISTGATIDLYLTTAVDCAPHNKLLFKLWFINVTGIRWRRVKNVICIMVALKIKGAAKHL